MKIMDMDAFEGRYVAITPGIWMEKATKEIYKVDFDYGKAIILERVK